MTTSAKRGPIQRPADVVVVIITVAIIVGLFTYTQLTLALGFIGLIVAMLWYSMAGGGRTAVNAAKKTPLAASRTAGTINAELVCPHCQIKGQVRTASVKVKKGISGGKATGALLTGGVSLLATGLSRKGYVTQATCGNCHMAWTIA